MFSSVIRLLQGRSALRAALLATTVAVVCGVPTSATAAAAAPRTCDGRTATVVGTADDDSLVGTDGDDVIWAGPGDDVVRAGAGDDLVCGNAGADSLSGEAGDDTLLGLTDAMRVDHDGTVLVGDTLRGGPGDDRLDVGTDHRAPGHRVVGDRVSWSGSATTVRVDMGAGTATGEGRDTVVARPFLTAIGSGLADVMVGSEGPDTLVGGPGGDTIEGLGGDDRLRPEGRDGRVAVDADVVRGGPGDDRIRSRSGVAGLQGGPGDDVIDSWSMASVESRGGDGTDALSLNLTRAGGQVLDGGPGADRLTMRRPGSQTPRPAARLDLAAGTLRIAWSTPTSARVVGLETAVLAPAMSWDVVGTARADHVEGAYRSRLRAHMGAGDDTVHGTGGADLIVGGAGRDTADGDDGRDVCRAVEARSSC